ncbi:MAG TPA: S8 family peptidase [Anaerolineae bacterium]|nr:S8 family peptidase [Anaerolineae bacterium]
MKKSVFVTVLAVVLIAALVAVPGSRPANAQALEGQAVPEQYIVKLAEGINSASAARELGRLHALTVHYTYSHAFNGFAARIPDAQLARLQADPRVVSIVADRYVQIDAKPTPPPPPGQTLPTGINRVDAELSATANINGVDDRVNVDVAVIDTGIDIDHPDLNVVGGYGCVTIGVWDDDNGHGSHVAGTIGAKDNTIGVVGVAPGARLWAVKVLNKRGSGTWSQIICGIDWVTANAATIEVANMSLGGGGTETGCDDGGMNEAICNAVNAGVTFVVAAGNESDDAAYHVPAAYDQVITVSALADFNGLPGGGAAPTCYSDVDDTMAYFSNYGADVDLIAPGGCIYSTYKGGGYTTMSGTSMASPHVAGGAALYKATHPSATPAQVKSALIGTGSTNWNNVDDPDGIKEPLLNVASY